MTNKKNIKIMLFCIVFFLIISVCICSKSAKTEFLKFKVASNDGIIDVYWQLSRMIEEEKVIVTIYNDGTLVDSITTHSQENSYEFKNGKHGKLYHVEAKIVDDSNVVVFEQANNAMFLEYDKLPDLPLLEISTDTGEDPVFDEADKPDGNLWGESIINNDFLPGNICITNKSERYVYDNIKIKVRGNTSALGSDKKPYKIRFDSAVNLIDYEEKFTQKDWVLLKNGNSLNTYVGSYIGELCGVEWNMHAKFVNVILNGDWKGCYYLVPAVCYEAYDGLIESDGFLFENDTYWWKPDTVYFKLNNQIYQLGYTLKYPKNTDSNDRRLISLKNYMQEFENLVLAEDERYAEFIDVDSFTSFLLAKDIIGEWDGGGSNFFLFKKNNQSKVKAGPLWDFDRSFETENEWSAIHVSDMFYYPHMLSTKVFNDAYFEKWANVSPELLENVNMFLEELDNTQGEAISDSWLLDNERWGIESDYQNQRQTMLNWFKQRIPWINNQIKCYAT